MPRKRSGPRPHDGWGRHGGFGRADGDGDRLFSARHSAERHSSDDLAERLAEAALEQLTGSYGGDFEQNDLQVDEELGGPFIFTGPEQEMGYGDGGWPLDTEVSARPRVLGEGLTWAPDD